MSLLQFMGESLTGSKHGLRIARATPEKLVPGFVGTDSRNWAKARRRGTSVPAALPGGLGLSPPKESSPHPQLPGGCVKGEERLQKGITNQSPQILFIKSSVWQG